MWLNGKGMRNLCFGRNAAKVQRLMLLQGQLQDTVSLPDRQAPMLPCVSGPVPLVAASADALLHCSSMAIAFSARLTSASGSALLRLLP
jgi:hypothetical protein